MDDEQAHETLKARPLFFAATGVLHTLLTAGIVFGWASLLPILRQEGIDLSPTEFASVFTHGAIGNYMSTLPFGYFLDRCGPKLCGIVASALFALGLLLCSFADGSPTCLSYGFGLIGFAGPAIQLPTLHLARLFPGEACEGGNGGAALFMSAQAGAFDGGTIVFALFSFLANAYGLSSMWFFRVYLVVPCMTLLTAIIFWPNTVLADPNPDKLSYVGAGSPYFSPASFSVGRKSALLDAPLSVILTKPPFYCLASWVAVHILKLNFVVATLNDQLHYAVEPDVANMLINIFGAMLPFGFVVLPVVAALLTKSTFTCFQIANAVGLLYGSVLAFAPGVASYEILVVFVSVATSRQLVYSTVFHQTGELFGFKHYGTLLGLANVVVSGLSLVQAPLVNWAESSQNYFGPNLILFLATLPLFVIVYGTIAASEAPKKRSNNHPTESSQLIPPHRRNSDGLLA